MPLSRFRPPSSTEVSTSTQQPTGGVGLPIRVGAKKVEKFTVTGRQVTLYLGDVKPGGTYTFEYTLKPKYPIKAKTSAAVAYEYYTPANRAATKPIELTVTEK